MNLNSRLGHLCQRVRELKGARQVVGRTEFVDELLDGSFRFGDGRIMSASQFDEYVKGLPKNANMFSGIIIVKQPEGPPPDDDDDIDEDAD